MSFSLSRLKAARYVTVRRMVRNTEGVTAVEFGLIGLPFFAVFFAIFECCMVLFAGQILETVVQDSGRKIFTGQAQAANWSQAAFKNEVCSHVVAIFDCQGNMYVDVKSYSMFSNITLTDPISGGNLNNNFTYQPGNPGDIVVIRLYYPWQLFVPTLGLNLSNMNGNKKLLVATAVFRNEPAP